MVKVSIVLPIYNVDPYLTLCLESLINQDLDSYEIICVNDGSPDNSKEIVIDYQKKYPFLKLINQTNQGLSVARNNGLKIAEGEYIFFVDSDDTIVPNCLKTLYETSLFYNLDILDFNYSILRGGSRKQFRGEILDLNIPCSGQDYLKQYIKQFNKLPFVSAWSHLFKREFLIDNDLCFIEYRLFEDFLFTAQAYYKASRVMYLNKSIYNYHPSDNSITKSKINPKRIQDWAFMSIEMSRFADKTGIKMPMDRFFSGYKNAMIQIFNNGLWKEYRNYFDKKLFKVNRFHLYKSGNKLVYNLSKVSFSVFVFYCRIVQIKRAIMSIFKGRNIMH